MIERYIVSIIVGIPLAMVLLTKYVSIVETLYIWAGMGPLLANFLALLSALATVWGIGYLFVYRGLEGRWIWEKKSST